MFCVKMTFDYVMGIPLQILPLLAADFDGDCLNILYIINKIFLEYAYATFNPRNAFYISKNDGLFNNDINHQRDILINATTLVSLSRKHYTEEDIEAIKYAKSLQ